LSASRAIEAALERAEDDRRSEGAFPDAEGRVRRIVAAVGDPQAPFAKLLAILDHHRLLGENGRLRPDVRLISLGDHFDYGPPDMRAEAGRNGVLALSWLAAHPKDQVIILVGNHDLARVGALFAFDDAAFEAVHREALAAYRARATNPALEAAFVERHPAFPIAEILARDYSTYSVSQRDLVRRLLGQRRVRLAYARDPSLLFVHAGVTLDDLALAGVPREDA
jgi:hypothetical protein